MLTIMIAPKQLAKSIIFAYQKLLSPFLKPSCRFQPTCSQYALEALDRFGLIRGVTLSLTRFCRCNPLFNSGYDPVPEIFRFFSSPKNS
tara:strand:- start:62 stop:328 length:267 start_codon:yes stop_codon:yes gene_type:complete